MSYCWCHYWYHKILSNTGSKHIRKSEVNFSSFWESLRELFIEFIVILLSYLRSLRVRPDSILCVDSSVEYILINFQTHQYIITLMEPDWLVYSNLIKKHGYCFWALGVGAKHCPWVLSIKCMFSNSPFQRHVSRTNINHSRKLWHT